MRWTSLLPLCWLMCAACGGSSTQSGSGGSAGESTGGSGGSGGASATCGAKPPQQDSPCKVAAGGGPFGSAADCSYGDDPRPQCRTFAVCSNGAWSVKEPGAECQVDAKPAACPGAPATPATACADATLRCWYDDGTVCSCSSCKGGTEYPICQTIDPPQWACVKPAVGCPNPPPQAGTACADPNLQCGTSCELPIRCENGAWQYGQAQCPICAAPDTPIATPQGERPIAELRIGELVYSVDNDAIVAVPIARVGSTPVNNHRVLRLTLSSGASLEISPNHPTASGVPLSSLAPGSNVDEAQTLVAAELVPYQYERTYDILPRSSSGTYFAGGMQLGSTLKPQR